jgi:hypothetical protein
MRAPIFRAMTSALAVLLGLPENDYPGVPILPFVVLQRRQLVRLHLVDVAPRFIAARLPVESLIRQPSEQYQIIVGIAPICHQIDPLVDVI